MSGKQRLFRIGGKPDHELKALVEDLKRSGADIEIKEFDNLQPPKYFANAEKEVTVSAANAAILKLLEQQGVMVADC